MCRVSIYTRPENGKIILPKELVRNYMRNAGARFDGKNIVVEIIIKEVDRSVQQNSYYWSVVVDMVYKKMREDGNNVKPLEVHEFLKRMFNELSVNIDFGKVEEVSNTTTKIPKNEFINEYIERVKAWASESLGIYIPDPHEAIPVFPD